MGAEQFNYLNVRNSIGLADRDKQAKEMNALRQGGLGAEVDET